ncbi:hypothetical protein Tco_1228781 [Tanacetum coccineum]
MLRVSFFKLSVTTDDVEDMTLTFMLCLVLSCLVCNGLIFMLGDLGSEHLSFVDSKESPWTGLPAQSVGSSNSDLISDIDVLGTGMLDWIARDGLWDCTLNKDTYSASAEDVEVQSCFLDDHLTSLSPLRNYMPPDVTEKISLTAVRCFSSFRLFSEQIMLHGTYPGLLAVRSIPCFLSIIETYFAGYKDTTRGLVDLEFLKELINDLLENRGYQGSWTELSYHALGACLRPYNASLETGRLCRIRNELNRSASTENGANDSSKIQFPSFGAYPLATEDLLRLTVFPLHFFLIDSTMPNQPWLFDVALVRFDHGECEIHISPSVSSWTSCSH